MKQIDLKVIIAKNYLFSSFENKKLRACEVALKLNKYFMQQKVQCQKKSVSAKPSKTLDACSEGAINKMLKNNSLENSKIRFNFIAFISN